MHLVHTPELAQTAVGDSRRYTDGVRSPNVWIDTLKILSNSVLENQKAALEQRYLINGTSPTGDRGFLYFDQPTLMSMMQDVARQGQGAAIHAIEDQAVLNALDADQAFRAAAAAGDSATRLIITHAQLVDPGDRSRFAKNNVIVQTPGIWVNVQPSMPAFLGQERNDTLQFPLRSWVQSGATLALGADWPATPGGFEHGVNPFNNIYTAMHRRPPKSMVAEYGSVDLVLPPANEVLTLAERIQAYTINGARQLGKEREIGTIEIGKKADLILLSQNLFKIKPEQIPATKVLATMFDGRIVHDKAYGIGDANLAEIDQLDRGAIGLCPHDGSNKRNHKH